MSAFEFNKWAGAVLSTALLLMVPNMFGDMLFVAHHDPTTPVYVVDTPEETRSTGPAEIQHIPLPLLLLAANPDLGKKTAKKCTVCHTLSFDGKDKIGPNLWDIVGRDKGSRANFRYSANLVKAGGKWTYNELNLFLESPKTYIPGTKMVFPGIKKREARAGLITYLRTLSDTPVPLPTN